MESRKRTASEVLDVIAFEIESMNASRLLVDYEYLLVAVARRLTPLRVVLRGHEAGRTARESADGYRMLHVAIDAERMRKAREMRIVYVDARLPGAARPRALRGALRTVACGGGRVRRVVLADEHAAAPMIDAEQSRVVPAVFSYTS